MRKLLKNDKFSFALLLLLTFFVLYFSLKDNFNSVIDQLKNINIMWLLVSFILIIGYWLFSSLAMYLITKKFNEKVSALEIFRINIITHFFNAVTPFSTGGQPYQIYALKKDNVKMVDSTNIVVENFVAYQTALILLGLIAIISNQIFDFFPDVRLLKILVLIGFLVNLFVAVGLFAVAFTQKFNKFVTKHLISFGSKLKLIKNKEETTQKFNDYVTKFHDGTKYLLKDKFNLVKVILLQILGLACVYVVPLPILFGMGDFTSFNVAIAIITSAYVMLIGAFVPLPGGTGGLEYSFVAFYGNFITGSKLTALMLMWRFVTYYFGMIVGGILLNISRRKKII